MSFVVSVHSPKAFQEFLLPAINNAEHSIILNKDLFVLANDAELQMEVIENRWHFLASTRYKIESTVNKEDYTGLDLKDKDLLTVFLPGGESVSIMVDETENCFQVFEKYDINNITDITIGSGENNCICYNTRNLVSKEHAVIKKRHGQCVIEDRSTNGIFVNSIRVVGSRQLNFGDCIHIFGLRMVFIGDVLAVDVHNENVQVNGKVLLPYQQTPPSASGYQERQEGHREKTLYHRSPRQIYKIDTDTVEIEPPPPPKTLDKKPIGMLVGPPMTMALPMLLGCGLAIYGNRSSGNTSGAFMYTGLITAISSAVIGTVWTLLNLFFERKKNREEELHRFEAYGEYLIKCANLIKEKYVKNSNSLRAMYLPAEECCKFNANNPLLWNRNGNHPDFLYYRIGTGSMPFQVMVNVPKERFTLVNDSLAEKPAMIQNSYRELHDVPICVDFLKHRIVGIVGGEKKRGAAEVMRSLVAQIATSNCYTDVKMVFLFDETRGEMADWKYLKWFPHVWTEDKKTRFIARNKTEAGDILYEITKSLRNRAANTDKDKENVNCPQYILFVTEQELLEGELITKYITAEDNRDLITVFLTDTYENLPNICDFIIQNDEHFCGMYEIGADTEERIQIQFDRVVEGQLEQLARILADIEVRETGDGGEIPNTLTFFEMYGIKRPEELHVIDKWRKNRTYENMKVLVGQKAGASPWYLDIHEKYHGPHGLIAGTTGSGKSEMLQTYILSLAINFSPDDVGFFLIDYKGGGMAHLFDGLPHIIGQISNLSGNQVKRAMVSIKSENKRRQKLFNEHGVNNINLYTRMYKNNEASEPIPHMFIIIDEFAELKREEPDFMRELISVAQVGRSLGVHLILATQKPSGTVDDNIWSNSKFRICLRVQDRQDSNDMLHRPDAAYITQAGRCYMQVGNDELFELFQSGFSGAVYDEDSGNVKSEIARIVSVTGHAALVGSRLKIKQAEKAREKWIQELLAVIAAVPQPKGKSKKEVLSDVALTEEYVRGIFEELGNRKIEYPYNDYNAQRIKHLLEAVMKTEQLQNNENAEEFACQVISCAQSHHLKLPERKQKTQLDAVIEHLADVARKTGYMHNMQLWLPVLPVLLYIQHLDGYDSTEYFDGTQWNRSNPEWELSVPIGMYDDPVNQSQGTLEINLSQNGHHAVIGTVVSGKSTFLQTFVYMLVQKYTPAEINVYAIDFSAGMLSAFTGMPHVGGVIFENEDDRAAKFFNMLSGILEERKKLFKGGNYEQYVRVNGIILPAIILVIDNYSNFRSKTNDRFEDVILQLSKDGVSYGIFIVITAGGFGAMEIPTKIGDNLRTVICLEMGDKFQYADAMRTMHIETLPEVNIKGRGLAHVGEDILEFQTALSFEAENDFKRMEEIEKVGTRMQSAWHGKKARPIPEIPANPVWPQFAELEETIHMTQEGRYLPIGYNVTNAAVYGIDLSRTYCYLIAGKSRSGKTNLLKLILQAAKMRRGQITIVDYGGDFIVPEENGSYHLVRTDKELYKFFNELKPDFIVRNRKKKADVQMGMSDEEIFQDMLQFEARFILIANLTDFVLHVTNPKDTEPMKAFVENLLDKGSLHNVYWMACYNQEDMSKVAGIKVYDYFLRYKTGIHFGGNVAGQRIMNFDYVPFTEQRKALRPGIGMLPANDEEDVRKVVIPLVKGTGM